MLLSHADVFLALLPALLSESQAESVRAFAGPSRGMGESSDSGGPGRPSPTIATYQSAVEYAMGVGQASEPVPLAAGNAVVRAVFWVRCLQRSRVYLRNSGWWDMQGGRLPCIVCLALRASPGLYGFARLGRPPVGRGSREAPRT